MGSEPDDNGAVGVLAQSAIFAGLIVSGLGGAYYNRAACGRGGALGRVHGHNASKRQAMRRKLVGLACIVGG